MSKSPDPYPSQDLQVVQGLDYKGEWALTWAEPFDGAWPELAGATGQFVMKQVNGEQRFVATATLIEKQAKVELSKLTTVDFNLGLYQYAISAVLPGRDKKEVGLMVGRIKVRPVE